MIRNAVGVIDDEVAAKIYRLSINVQETWLLAQPVHQTTYMLTIPQRQWIKLKVSIQIQNINRPLSHISYAFQCSFLKLFLICLL